MSTIQAPKGYKEFFIFLDFLKDRKRYEAWAGEVKRTVEKANKDIGKARAEADKIVAEGKAKIVKAEQHATKIVNAANGAAAETKARVDKMMKELAAERREFEAFVKETEKAKEKAVADAREAEKIFRRAKELEVLSVSKIDAAAKIRDDYMARRNQLDNALGQLGE